MRAIRSLATVVSIVLLGGCVERTMQIDTDPAGALVYANDQEIGRTPIERDFTWYGDYDVEVRKEGYHTLKTNQSVIAPWWQWPPIDLFAELLPVRLKDQRKIQYVLQVASTQPVEPEEILSRASALEGMLESSKYTKSRAPSTQPATNTTR